MPKLELRAEERPLWEDVRRLGSSLGETIARLEGRACYDDVESLRVACRDRRRNGGIELSPLLARVEALSLESSAVVARAFTLFLFLVNIAEQVHRARSWRASANAMHPEPSVRSALETLRDSGVSAAAARRLIADTKIRPVLTAHPTEATRRTLLALGARLADALMLRETDNDDERARAERRIDAEIELLWLTSEVRRDRPSVLDEVSNVIWYLEDRLLDASALTSEALQRAFQSAFGEPLGVDVPLAFGSWVGGDRDGNPHVTPEVTLRAARRVAHAVLGRQLDAVRGLIEALAVSETIAAMPVALRESLAGDRARFPGVWQENQRRDADEPLRLKLSFVAARIEAARRQLAARDGGAASGTLEPGAYESADELVADLELVGDALAQAGAHHARHTLVEPLLTQIRLHGLHGFSLDVREDSSVHTRALDEITERLGIGPLGPTEIECELVGRRPILSRHGTLGSVSERVVGTFDAIAQIQAELGERAASTYVVSMTHDKYDLLRVLLFAREAGLVDLAADPPISRLDVVPLFETLGDLDRSSQVLEQLLADRAYARQLEARGRRQEIMIGYSDSAKGAGVLTAAWALYRAQERLAALAEREQVRLTLFHGRGGTVGRGGGSPVYRALLALPPGTLGAGLKVTEQGEVVSQKFGIRSIAERSLHVLIAGALEAAARDWRTSVPPAAEARYRAAMDELSASALAVYRRVVEDERSFSLLMQATPLRELSHVHFGSRPAYRAGGSGTMQGIRAIPWVFGWTQIRSNLPGWLGVGTALRNFSEQPGGLELLCEMARAWPFFDDLLSKVEMVCAKTDLEIARLYVERLASDLAPFDELEREHRRTVDAILAIRKTDRLLAGDRFLESAIAVRNPYIDPLSLLQVTLLAKKRELSEDAPERVRRQLDAVLGTTLNGIAQGLRNTG